MPGEKQSPHQQFEIILDSITDGVFTVDLDFKIQSFNRAAEKITGIPRKEALGRPCCEVFRTDVCETACLIRQTIESGAPLVNRPVFIMKSDGIRIPISVTASLLTDTNGTVVGGVETFRDMTSINQLRKALQKRNSFEVIVSKNPKMLKLFDILPQIAGSDSTVLIEGASGTGKELFARAIHNCSPRHKGPFIAVNCGALPDTLIESELFGYKAGAFTDAKKDKPGRFAKAQNGTIFLDEIGDVSLPVQIRFLRVLQEKIYEPLGSNTAVKTNARVIAATHRDLELMVTEDLFREDLFYRINIIKLTLPPLNQRKEDIPLLVDHFIQELNIGKGKQILGITPEAMASLMLHNWPGNVRELENVMEHAFVLCRESLITTECLPEKLHPQKNSLLLSQSMTLKEIEKKTISLALERNHWKKMKTARELGIDKNTLRRKIQRYGITPPA